LTVKASKGTIFQISRKIGCGNLQKSQRTMNHQQRPEESFPRESSPEAEKMARFYSMPPRRMLGTIGDGSFYVLECGHMAPATVPLDNAQCARCGECYKEQMLKAEKMLEW
jgi:hypothetical protein